MSRRVIFGSREAFIHRTWNELGLLQLVKDWGTHDYLMLDCSFTNTLFVNMFSSTNRGYHKLFKFVKLSDKVFIMPKVFQDIDNYVFTKFEEDASLAITEKFLDTEIKHSDDLFYLRINNGKYLKKTYISQGFEDMYESSNNNNLYTDFVKYRVFKTKHELFKNEYMKIGAWDRTTYCDQDGWLIDARFNNRPEICNDAALFERRVGYNEAFQTHIEHIRLKGLHEMCLPGTKPF